MLTDNSVIRFIFKAMSIRGLSGGQCDSETCRGDRAGQKDSPFVLVGRASDGRWGVFQRDFNSPLASFDDIQLACDYANELARTRSDSMVLIQKGRDPAFRAASSGVDAAR